MESELKTLIGVIDPETERYIKIDSFKHKPEWTWKKLGEIVRSFRAGLSAATPADDIFQSNFENFNKFHRFPNNAEVSKSKPLQSFTNFYDDETMLDS